MVETFEDTFQNWERINWHKNDEQKNVRSFEANNSDVYDIIHANYQVQSRIS